MAPTNAPSQMLSAMPEARAALLEALKRRGTATLQELASDVGHTREAARQQMELLMRDGWIVRDRVPARGRGRPNFRYRLSEAGDHLFPKHYDEFGLTIVDTVSEAFGPEGLRKLLAALTDRQVARWRDQLAGLGLQEKLQRLKGVYFEQDPWAEVHHDERGWALVERNCPFLSLARRRPQLCSVTVSTLSRILGCRVRREARFQDGDARCVFRVFPDEPLPEDFSFEWEPEYAGDT